MVSVIYFFNDDKETVRKGTTFMCFYKQSKN